MAAVNVRLSCARPAGSVKIAVKGGGVCVWGWLWARVGASGALPMLTGLCGGHVGVV